MVKAIKSRVTDIALCSEVILDLVSDFEQFGQYLYNDNYYTNPAFYI